MLQGCTACRGKHNDTEAQRRRLSACSTDTKWRTSKVQALFWNARERIGASTLKSQVESTRNLSGWPQSRCALKRSWSNLPCFHLISSNQTQANKLGFVLRKRWIWISDNVLVQHLSKRSTTPARASADFVLVSHLFSAAAVCRASVV